MTINFVLNSRVRKDKKNNVRIRISNGRNSEKKVTTQINVLKDFWKDERVSNKHPDYDVINRVLKKLKDKKEHCIIKFDAGEWTLQQVARYLAGESDYNSVDSYVKTIFKRRKTNVTFLDYLTKLNILKSHMGIAGDLKFKDINRNWFYDLLKILQKKGLSKSSIRSYSIAIGSILKDAFEEGVIQEIPKRPKEFKTGGKKDRNRKKIESVQSKDVEKAIKNITNITQWQSVGFWLICYGLRGLYPADIVKMTEAELDKPTYLKEMKDELFLEHLRSKSEHTDNEHMYIHINRNIKNLICQLKMSIAFTHSKSRQTDVASVNDTLKIFNYNPTDNYKFHLNKWAVHTRRLRKLSNGKMSLKNARKTFLTYAKEQDINEDTRKILVGRMNDPIFSKHYDNNETIKMRNKVTDAHNKVLKAFVMEKLLAMMRLKLELLKAPAWVNGVNFIMYNVSRDGKPIKNPVKLHLMPQYKGYEWYWRNYKNIEDSDYYNKKEVMKYYKEQLKKNEEIKSKVIKLNPDLVSVG